MLRYNLEIIKLCTQNIVNNPVKRSKRVKYECPEYLGMKY